MDPAGELSEYAKVRNGYPETAKIQAQRGLYPRSTAWKVNAACAALPFLRTWYNNRTRYDPDNREV